MITKLAQIIKGELLKQDILPRHLSIKITESKSDEKITESYLSRWLNGNLEEDPSDSKVMAIAEVLGLEKDDLLNHSTRKESYTLSETTGALKLAFSMNKKSSPEIKTLLDLVSKSEISKDKWEQILNIVKE